jgi:hypothetical protein
MPSDGSIQSDGILPMKPNLDDWLRSDERVLWSGRPVQGIMFVPTDLLLVPFSLVWAGFALIPFAAGGTPAKPPTTGLPFTLVSLVFVAVAAFVTVGRFLVDAWLRANTLYAVTDKRIMIVRGWPFGSAKGIPLKEFGGYEVTSKKGRPGTLKLAANAPGRSNWSMFMPSLVATPQFIRIQNPHEVLDTILDAQRAVRDA